jgi:hypothetical protein
VNPRQTECEAIVPPGKDAVPGPTASIAESQGDDNVLPIQKLGRFNWQSASGYTRRHKGVIGGTLKSRGHAQRNTAVAIAKKTLNRMRLLGQASFVRVA